MGLNCRPPKFNLFWDSICFGTQLSLFAFGTQSSISLAKHQKIEGGPFGENFSGKKVSQCRKNLKGGPFSLSRYGMSRGKRGKTFLVQFARPNEYLFIARDNKKFRRTFENYFGQFVWIEKKRVTIHEAPSKKK